MAKTVDEYIAGVSGWQAEAVAALRADILAAGGVTEGFKWGHPIYESAEGPVCLFKAHKAHVTFGLWRGAEMVDIDKRLEAGGSFAMASIKIEKPGEVSTGDVKRLVTKGVALNKEKGDPSKMK